MKKRITSFLLIMCMLVVATTQVNAASKKGTAKVWAGLPLGGFVSVCTPYNVTHYGSGDHKYIYSIKTGKSYTGAGISLLSYSHYKSWGTKTGKTTFRISAQGKCSVLFKNCPVSIGLQTFAWYGRF